MGKRAEPRQAADAAPDAIGIDAPLGAGAEPNEAESVLELPLVQTVLFLAVGGAAFRLLGRGEGNGDFVGSNPWIVWKVSAALGIALAITLGAHGFATVARVADDGRYPTTRRAAVVDCVAALLVVVAVGVFLATVQDGGAVRAWPVPGIDTRLLWTATAASLPATPWIALVWMAHGAERRSAPETSATLDHRWELIVSCAQAFALFVVIALVPTGALRSAFLSTGGSKAAVKELEKQFPPSDVLTYGAFYAILLVVIIVPLVAAWRARAKAYIDLKFPLDHDIDATWVDGRGRLEKLHHLDVGLIRNPLTSLSVLTPLVTATLATFVPQLGGA